MFDPMGTFTKQFTPVEGGYLYYPSRKSGGKLVTADELTRLASDWQRIVGRRGQWKTVGSVVLAIMLWTIVSRSLALADWTDQIITIGVVAALSGWLLWASFAPRRLVKDRPVIAPPRPTSQARREARAVLNWPFVIFAILMSGGIFVGSFGSSDRTLAWWAWVIGSGVMLVSYLWIAFRKVTDAQR